ncbi:MAG: YeeE/YedE family protein, partial [Alphaproteobacteria bacterium]
MIPFDPISALAGGVLIGLGAVILALFNGRVAGISGIL